MKFKARKVALVRANYGLGRMHLFVTQYACYA